MLLKGTSKETTTSLGVPIFPETRGSKAEVDVRMPVLGCFC